MIWSDNGKVGVNMDFQDYGTLNQILDRIVVEDPCLGCCKSCDKCEYREQKDERQYERGLEEY